MISWLIINQLILLICLWMLFYQTKFRLDKQLQIIKQLLKYQYKAINHIKEICKECKADKALDEIIDYLEK